MRDLLVLPITEASQVAEARRLAMGLARSLGFSETDVGKVALVVTETAQNLVKHTTQGGQLLVRSLQRDGVRGLEILSLDQGPGMADVAACLRDGYSTAGSPGTGLGAILRLSAWLDIHSLPGVGTVLLARLWARPLPQELPRPALEIGAVCVPKPNEEACGDAWAADQSPDRSRILVVDGLGHGIGAAEASGAAVRAFENRPQLTPVELVEAIHAALRKTRGAAIAVAEVDVAQQVVRFVGVGNIAGAILSSEGAHHLVSHNGTAGHELRKIQEFTYRWPPGAVLVMHSDGCATRWSLDGYPGLAGRDPSMIAGVLYRDFRRGYDDVAVVVAKALGDR